MPVNSLWMLNKSDVTVSDGASLDGVTQGTGVHLLGKTITLGAPNWQETRISDDDANFDDNDAGQYLDGAQTINGVGYASGTRVEAEYTLTLQDPGTGLTYKVVGFNVLNSSPAYGTIEGLAFLGPQSAWPPVGVPLTVIANAEGPGGGSPVSAYDAYVTPACFTPGTQILTSAGLRPVERLSAGDLVTTMDHGPQPLLQVARTRLSPDRLLRAPHLCPVLIPQGSLGHGVPARDMVVSPQHRFVQRGARCELLFGTDEVLVAAQDLPQARPVPLRRLGWGVTYLHLVFAQHEVVLADGAESESLLIGPTIFFGGGAAMQHELLALFPDLDHTAGPRWPKSARVALRSWEARLLAPAAGTRAAAAA